MRTFFKWGGFKLKSAFAPLTDFFIRRLAQISLATFRTMKPPLRGCLKLCGEIGIARDGLSREGGGFAQQPYAHFVVTGFFILPLARTAFG